MRSVSEKLYSPAMLRAAGEERTAYPFGRLMGQHRQPFSSAPLEMLFQQHAVSRTGQRSETRTLVNCAFETDKRNGLRPAALQPDRSRANQRNLYINSWIVPGIFVSSRLLQLVRAPRAKCCSSLYFTLCFRADASCRPPAASRTRQ